MPPFLPAEAGLELAIETILAEQIKEPWIPTATLLAKHIVSTAHFRPRTFSTPEQNFHGTDMSRTALAIAPEARLVAVLCSGESPDELAAVREAVDRGIVVSWSTTRRHVLACSDRRSPMPAGGMPLRASGSRTASAPIPRDSTRSRLKPGFRPRHHKRRPLRPSSKA